MTVQELYSNSPLVARYAEDDKLQPPESSILAELCEWLADKTVLDIGVGGGRTTRHLAGLAQRYVGVDISPEMISACLERFEVDQSGHRASSRKLIEFMVCDVRDMSMFDDNTFDFVLFSYNGIDHITGESRAKALEEIHRVAKPAGFFCFSAHNIQHLDRHALGIRRIIPRHPKRFFRKKLVQKVSRWVVSRLSYNRHLYRKDVRSQNEVVVYYGRFGLRFGLCYIKPAEQLKQLSNLFKDVRVFSLSGREVEPQQIESARDEWLYYLGEVT